MIHLLWYRPNEKTGAGGRITWRSEQPVLQEDIFMLSIDILPNGWPHWCVVDLSEVPSAQNEEAVQTDRRIYWHGGFKKRGDPPGLSKRGVYHESNFEWPWATLFDDEHDHQDFWKFKIQDSRLDPFMLYARFKTWPLYAIVNRDQPG